MIEERNVCDVCGIQHTFDEKNRLYTPEQAGPVWFDVEVGIGNRESLPRVNTCGVKCVTKVLPEQIKTALAHLEKMDTRSHVRVEITKRQLPST